MYYRTPENHRHTPYPSEDVPIPENYSGNVFYTSGGRTSFVPLEEQAMSSMEKSAVEIRQGTGSDDQITGTNGEWENDAPVNGEVDATEAHPAQMTIISQSSADPLEGSTEPTAIPDATMQVSAPTGPAGIFEQFSLPHTIGSEELFLLGLMYLTASKPDDDLWIYLLVLLFCGG